MVALAWWLCANSVDSFFVIFKYDLFLLVLCLLFGLFDCCGFAYLVVLLLVFWSLFAYFDDFDGCWFGFS